MNNPTQKFVPFLLANGPNHKYSSQLMLYGQFIGEWDGRVIVYFPDGTQCEESCEVSFEWVLDGKAIQEVWIAPAREDRIKKNSSGKFEIYGTTLRVYDPKIDKWHILWIDPSYQAYDQMLGEKVGKDIVQKNIKEDGTISERCFTEITKESFHWIGKESKDNGKTWKIIDEFYLHRKTEN